MSIKVFIDTSKFKGGPGIFRTRLIKAFKNFDNIKITTDINNKFDIELVFIRKLNKLKKPYVLRLDNCWYIYKYKTYNNKPIEKTIRHSNHIIFQSQFAFKLCERTLRLRPDCPNGKNMKYSIIYNGADIHYIENIKPDKTIIPKSFVSCARWDSNKRPISIMNGFLEAGTDRHLYMIGGIGVEGKRKGYKSKSKYIHFLGEKTNKEIIAIMKACSYQIHLCHIDTCPNIVIEGLLSGLNVLCTNLGGTKEIVKSDGVILNVDKFWKGRYMKPRNVDNIKSKIVARGIHKLLKIKNKPIRPDLDIDIVAQKYINVIRGVQK